MNNNQKVILVLEDEKSLLEAIKSKFETENCGVVSAKSVNQALDYLKEGVKIDAVWLDHYLFGRKNGLDFISEVRKEPRWKNLPIFVVSNTVSPDKVKQYLDLGVKKCYTKVDYRLDKIINDIKNYLKA